MSLRPSGASRANGPKKSWVFTLNNYTEEHIDLLTKLGEDKDLVTYLVAGREVGESGTPHLQGCVTFRGAHRRRAVSQIIPGAFLEATKFIHKAREYCMKEDPDPILFDHRKQGTRSDLEAVVQTLQTHGASSYRVALEHPETYIKFHGGIDKLACHYQVPRDPANPPEVWWIYGSTGAGKSRFVHERESDLWVALGTHKWWEGYSQQEAILIDDMRCNYAPFNELLKILDRYPYRAERKGGSIHVNSHRMYITSQFPPHKVYNPENRSGEDIRQLYRRVTHVVHAQKSYTSLPDSSFSILRHGVLFQKKDIEELIDEDTPQANAPYFAFPT